MNPRWLALAIVCAVLTMLADNARAQVSGRMLQYPAVSQTHIAFVYGGDIWIVPKEGGIATRLSSPKGQELFPKFSPDGKSIAFSGNYDGNMDIYVVPTFGGLPERITYHGMPDRLLGWYPDGEKLLFASARESGRQRFNQFYAVSRNGGFPEKLPLPYGEFGAISPDGKTIAYTPSSQAFRTWKRYRGGWAADIWIFRFSDYAAENVTMNPANDEMPMWFGSTLYFLSDRGAEERSNIWAYDLVTKQTRQVTRFSDFDIHFPSIGPSDIVFEAGGRLYLLDLKTEQHHEVLIKVVTDEATIKPSVEKAEQYITKAGISPDGKRALVEARGEIFSLPAEHGVIRNLTATPGVAERNPAWAPDGKSIAYWSDRSGEYELTVRDMTKPDGAERKLTSYGPGFRYNIFWSPDSKMLAFVDNTMSIKIYALESDKTYEIDKGLWMSHGPLENFQVSWSADSRWMAYANDLDNRSTAIYLYDIENKSRHQITSGFYADARPAFDPDGKYLYFLTNRTFAPIYGDVDNSFLYANTTSIAAVSLRNDVASPMAPRNDEVDLKKEEKKEETEKKDQPKDKAKDKPKEPLKIDLDGFENRVVLLPPQAGNYTDLQAVSGKVVYRQLPNTGSGDKKKPIKYYDLEAREDKTVIDDADGFDISADGKKLLVSQSKSLGIIDLKPDQKLEKKINTADMTMMVDPKAEWRQLFREAWRLERDYFYDANMHGVNWKGVYDRYAPLIEQSITRWDVDYVLGEMIAELNSSHTYRGGGAAEQAKSLNVGYLGVDWELKNGAYMITKIIRGASWDADTRSPLALPGVNVKEGEYVLAVNGVDIDVKNDPWAAFQGLGGKTIELLVNSKPSKEGARKIVVEALADETRLRNLAWIESNRKNVDKASGGRIGYLYVQDTGTEGQSDLVRQFAGQFAKDGLIVDERFNSGGQIPDRFIELLNRKPLAYWAVRNGRTWQWPPVANFGPKAMLINGWSGSGGDAFPDYFRKAGLGPLIGTRTWGGLIGMSGVPSLIDGGTVTVPTFRMYDPDGKWFAEGHGVDPDIQVIDDPSQMARGIDPQLDRAIQEVVKALKDHPTTIPKHAPYEKR